MLFQMMNSANKINNKESGATESVTATEEQIAVDGVIPDLSDVAEATAEALPVAAVASVASSASGVFDLF